MKEHLRFLLAVLFLKEIKELSQRQSQIIVG